MERAMRFCAEWRWAALAAVLSVMICGSAGQAQDTGLRTDLAKEAARADALYQKQNLIAAAPLYEDLLKQQPESLLWKERLAISLLGLAHTQTDAQATATVERAHKLLLEAKAAGDNSPLVQVVLEKMDQAAAGPKAAGPLSPGADAFGRAEKAFSSGQLADAVKLYQEAAAADPKMYEAPLYAGDSEFKMGNCAEAERFYAQAVAIDPNRETAFRYWGDCLMKLGEQKEAEGKYIDALLAQPYSQATRLNLKKWADGNHAQAMPPPIALPAAPTSGGKDKNGKAQININIDPSSLGSPVSSAVLAYSMNAALWQGDKFHQNFPNEKQYRHSLAEERDSIEIALSVLKEQKIKPEKLDATWKTLLALDADGMVECWILLDNPDQGIAQDYVAYRASHRELLHAYVAKYDVHPM
jgi:tetratricopeptide (TPR) repeat protein